MLHEKDQDTAIHSAQGGIEKADYVKGIFSAIAPRYDLLNHLLSLNIDKAWRRKAIRELKFERKPTGRYLDLCAGTLDVSNALIESRGFRGSVVGVDFAEPMLRAGRAKVAGKPVSIVAADALELPLLACSMAGAIVAFGIRNVQGLDASLREVHRVLEPGARFVILEFSTPRSPLINAGYQIYFNNVLPRIGGWVSGNRSAYQYLPRSVASFPVEEELARRMGAAGFVNVEWRSLTLGVAAIHCAERPL
ncbi:MAG: bifunctional demethylmenaquinone methyltransferase/2-methoxy-6-polyprenyl-1,4-benzoquinol methylase UbiE [Gemmatimonadales bacterium]